MAYWGLLARNLAAELGQHGITVNCVSPSGVLTGMGTKGHTSEEIKAAVASLNEIWNLKGEILKPEGVWQGLQYSTWLLMMKQVT